MNILNGEKVLFVLLKKFEASLPRLDSLAKPMSQEERFDRKLVQYMSPLSEAYIEQKTGWIVRKEKLRTSFQ
jgi:hypothetical protein